MKILVADDDAPIRSLVRVSIEMDRPDIVLLEARDGEEAVDIARREQPDIIILDESMPKLCGEDCIPLIRYAAPHARIVLFSACEPDRLQEMSMRAGVAAFEKTDVDGMVAAVLAWAAPAVR